MQYKILIASYCMGELEEYRGSMSLGSAKTLLCWVYAPAIRLDVWGRLAPRVWLLARPAVRDVLV